MRIDGCAPVPGHGRTIARAPTNAGPKYAWECCYTPFGSYHTVCDYYDEDGNFVGSVGDTAKPTPALAPASPGQVKPSLPPPQTAP
jgi:hypothetical protein